MKLKTLAVYIFLTVLFIAFITNTDTTIAAVRNALYLNAETVIPSLFPFFVLSSLMINTGFVNALGKLFSPIAKRVFKTGGNGAVVFVMGMLCGYPTGAKMVAELYKNNMIKRNDAERLLPFCNNSGPVFVIGAVGGMLGDVNLGVKLYIIHIISAFITGVVLSFGAEFTKHSQTDEIKAINLGKAVSDSVCSAVKTMLNVCGYIVFFAVLNTFIIPIIHNLAKENIFGIFLSGLTEVTLGAENIISQAIDFKTMFVMLSGILGFGGMCVFLQVTGIVSDAGLSSKKYVFGKTIQMTVSMIIAKLFVPSFQTQNVFLNAYEITKKYTDSAPIILISFFLALAYFSARKN